MINAVKAKWECPSCGNIITKQEILIYISGSYRFKGPERCGCGRKGKFTLLSFENAYAVIVDNKKEAIVVSKTDYEDVRNYANKKSEEEEV